MTKAQYSAVVLSRVWAYSVRVSVLVREDHRLSNMSFDGTMPTFRGGDGFSISVSTHARTTVSAFVVSSTRVSRSGTQGGSSIYDTSRSTIGVREGQRYFECELRNRKKMVGAVRGDGSISNNGAQ